MLRCLRKKRRRSESSSESPEPDSDFFRLIDFNPWDDEARNRADFMAIQQAIKRNPRALQAKYNFRSMGRGYTVNYPLNRLIALGAPMPVLRRAIQQCPEALDPSEAYTPLHAAACYRAPLPVVRLLLRKGPRDLAQRRTKHADTALHLACSRNASLAVVKLLVELYPEAQWRKNKLGRTPLEAARQCDPANEQVVRCLTVQEEGIGASQPMTVCAEPSEL